MDAVSVIALVIFAAGLVMVIGTFRPVFTFKRVSSQLQFIIGLCCLVISFGLIASKFRDLPVLAQQIIGFGIVVFAILFSILIFNRLKSKNIGRK